MARLDGKVAIVTGAARGQGEAEARLFAAEGAQVIVADILDELGGAVAADIGDAARYVHLDVTAEHDWEAAIATCSEHFGPPSVLVSNAGIFDIVPIVFCSLEQFRRVLDVNLIGTFNGIRAITPSMAAAGGGSIIVIGSAQALRAAQGLLAYVASKFAVRGLAKVAALELGGLGIRVNCIHPGAIDTEMIHRPEIDAVQQEKTFRALPLGRGGTVGDVAPLALYLASDESAYVTAADFVVDGGLLGGFFYEGIDSPAQ